MESADRRRNHGVHSGIVAETTGGLLRELRQSFAFLPALRKPSIAMHCLRTARRAQVALAMSFVVLLLLLPPVVETGMNRAFPPRAEPSSWIVRVAGPAAADTTTRPDPRAAQRTRQVLAVAWAAAGATVLSLFVLHVPVAVARAGAVARTLERGADRERGQSRLRALFLYREALSLASEPEHEAAIIAKMRELS